MSKRIKAVQDEGKMIYLLSAGLWAGVCEDDMERGNL